MMHVSSLPVGSIMVVAREAGSNEEDVDVVSVAVQSSWW